MLSRRAFLRWVGVAAARFVLPDAVTWAIEQTWRVTGQDAPELVSFDQAIQEMMQLHDIPNGALAIAQDDRLILARGYSWNDGGMTTQPNTLFRIASVSKPFTATGVLLLAQAGKLGLDDAVADLVDMSAKQGTPDPRLGQITVRMLLQHLGGWDRNLAFDPMFETGRVKRGLGIDEPVTQEDIIGFMSGEPLQYDPGTHVAYSNYGYMLLGRVIEAASGQPYETYIQDHVLSPIGITQMQLAGATRKERLENEVEYFSQEDATQPYDSFDIRLMDSHGGWLASAVDLVRFGALHGALLNRTFLDIMFGAPLVGAGENSTYYGCGWHIYVADGAMVTAYHAGNLPGTVAVLQLYRSGLTWAVLFNQCDDNSAGMYLEDIGHYVDWAGSQVEALPEGEIFQ
jgi:CubicO group peptidase (beta-lactamase class C family)